MKHGPSSLFEFNSASESLKTSGPYAGGGSPSQVLSVGLQSPLNPIILYFIGTLNMLHMYLTIPSSGWGLLISSTGAEFGT